MIFLKNDLSEPLSALAVLILGFIGFEELREVVLAAADVVEDVAGEVDDSGNSSFFLGLDKRLMNPAMDLSVLKGDFESDVVCVMGSAGFRRIDEERFGGGGMSSPGDLSLPVDSWTGFLCEVLATVAGIVDRLLEPRTKGVVVLCISPVWAELRTVVLPRVVVRLPTVSSLLFSDLLDRWRVIPDGRLGRERRAVTAAATSLVDFGVVDRRLDFWERLD